MLGHEAPFHFRKYLLRYVQCQVDKLVVPQFDQTAQNPPNPPNAWTPENPLTTANDGYIFPLRLNLLRPLTPTAVSEFKTYPACFLSYDGGRKEVTENTLMQNIVEVIGVRLEIALHADYGAPNAMGQSTELSEQVGDAIFDIERLVNYNSFQAWLSQPVSVGDSQDPNIDDPAQLTRFRQQAVIVQDVMLTEWGFDEFYRGTENEVIIAIVQFFMSYPKQ